ncbi:hypothetical protein [Bifidobacterium rousetti]|uniref:hypothetical protein n=1 Tax=Bifidobacterium rousetti TaxID=2045439 RepID=UPI00123A433E|nr:hypothetical protein [Bifidobacterium rousetti]
MIRLEWEVAMVDAGFGLVLVARDVALDAPFLRGTVGCLEVRDGVFAWDALPETVRILGLIPPRLFRDLDVERVYARWYELVLLEYLTDDVDAVVLVSFPDGGVRVGVMDGVADGVAAAGLDVMRWMVEGSRTGGERGGHIPVS